MDLAVCRNRYLTQVKNKIFVFEQYFSFSIISVFDTHTAGHIMTHNLFQDSTGEQSMQREAGQYIQKL